MKMTKKVTLLFKSLNYNILITVFEKLPGSYRRLLV